MQPFIAPPYLQPGNQVSIVAPGYAVERAAMRHAIDILTTWGVQVVEGQNLYGNQSPFSSTDAHRLHDMQAALNAPEVKAILCARGGYGTTRIIDQLNFDAFKAAPKWLVGFSDITALHAQLYHLGYQSLHATMPKAFDHPQSPALQSLKALLFGEPTQIQLKASKYNIAGNANGPLFGGNLSILVHLLGTPTWPTTAGAILFIEDIDEPLYKVDRMLVQLKRAGVLQNLAAVLVGNFSATAYTDTTFALNFYDMLLVHLAGLNIPVVFDFPVGHEGVNKGLPQGRVVQLTSGPQTAVLDIPAQ